MGEEEEGGERGGEGEERGEEERGVETVRN